MPRKKAFKRAPICDVAYRLAEHLFEQLDNITLSGCPYIGYDYRASLEEMGDRIYMQIRRVDETQLSLGQTAEEAEQSGAAQQLRRMIQTVTGVWYGGRSPYREL